MRDPQHAARLFRERRPRNGEGDQSGDTRKTGKPVSPMTLARAFARELESGATEFHTLVGNFILCAILGKKPALGEAIKSEQVRMTAAIFYAKTKMGWRETVVNERGNKDDKPFDVDDARQRLIDEVDRIRARKEQKGE